MTIEQALNFYGSYKKIAEVLHRSKSSVSLHKSAGGFPYEFQCVLEKDSNGALVADRDHDPRTQSQAA